MSLQGGWIDIPLNQSGTDAFPYIMSLESGNFLAMWEGPGSDGYFTAYDSTGSRIVNPTPLYADFADRSFPSGDVFADGRFVLAYRYYAEGVEQGMRAQIFSPAISKAGPEIVVGSGWDQLESASVVVLSDGTFVIAYENRTARTSVLKRYSSGGIQLGASLTLPEQGVVVQIAARPAGGFVLAFQTSWAGNTVTRTYDNALAEQTTVSIDANFTDFKIAALENGEFAVVGIPFPGNVIRVLRYNANNSLKSNAAVAVTDSCCGDLSITAVDDACFVAWTDANNVCHGQLLDSRDSLVGKKLNLFSGNVLAVRPCGAYYNDVFFVAVYDLDGSDSFLRRLAK